MEESFKRLKSNLKLEKAHAKTPALYVQEVEARVLLDTITLKLQKKIKEPSYIYTFDTYVTHILRNVKKVSNRPRSRTISNPMLTTRKRGRLDHEFLDDRV